MPELMPLLAMLFLATMTAGLLVGMFRLVKSSLYSLKWLKRQKMQRSRRRPLISIIIFAHNDQTYIERCLESIRHGSYRKYEVIIVDNASTDDTKRLIKGFIAKYPKQVVRLIAKRKPMKKRVAFKTGFKAKGELIMLLDANYILDKHALRQAALHFTADKSIDALVCNVRTLAHSSILGLLQQYEQLSNYEFKKFYMLSGPDHNQNPTGIVYRRNAFKDLPDFGKTALAEGKNLHLHYGGDVVVYTEPITASAAFLSQHYQSRLTKLRTLLNKKLLHGPTNKRAKPQKGLQLLLTVWSELMLLLAPFMLTYFIYLAVAFRYSTLLAISWAVVSVLLALVVLSDEYLTLWQKLRLGFFIPMMFGIFYVMSFIHVLATIKSLFNLKKITKKIAGKSTWPAQEKVAT